MIKKYRLQNNYTLEHLAELTNISWRNLQRIENGGYKKAKFETIAKLIKILNIDEQDVKKLIDECSK